MCINADAGNKSNYLESIIMSDNWRADLPERAFQLALYGMNDKDIAATYDISPNQFTRWVNENRDGIRDHLIAARAEMGGKMAHAMYKAALDGDVPAAKFMLKNAKTRYDGNWADNHAGSAEQPFQVEVTDKSQEQVAREVAFMIRGFIEEMEDKVTEEEEKDGNVEKSND